MRLLALGLFASFLMAQPLLADTTYTYTGKDFTEIEGYYTTNDFVHGSFTVASPLGTDHSGMVNPLSYSFTDGVQTFSTPYGYSPMFDVTTDGSGNITSWDIWVGSFSGYAQYIAMTPTGDEGSFGVAGGAANSVGGTWTSSAGVRPTPEPGSLELVGIAALGIAARCRRCRKWLRV